MGGDVVGDGEVVTDAAEEPADIGMRWVRRGADGEFGAREYETGLMLDLVLSRGYTVSKNTANNTTYLLPISSIR